MVDKIAEGYVPSKDLIECYGSEDIKILNSLFQELGRYTYNIEKFGDDPVMRELSWEYFEKSRLEDYLKRGAEYFKDKIKEIKQELINQGICELIQSPEFRNSEKIVLFISGVLVERFGLALPVSIVMGEILAVYGVEKICQKS
jgi:hypothetical protein